MSGSNEMNDYWFKPKTYGYGAVASTWQGWALTGVFGLLVGGSAVVMAFYLQPSGVGAWIAWLVVVAVLTLAFVFVAKQKTDGEWRWRKGGEMS